MHFGSVHRPSKDHRYIGTDRVKSARELFTFKWFQKPNLLLLHREEKHSYASVFLGIINILPIPIKELTVNNQEYCSILGTVSQII